MPRAGANYVFTSRILSPFLGWLESFCLLIAVIAVIAILLPLALLMFNYTGAAMEIAFPDSSFLDGAAGWFSDSDVAVHRRDGHGRARVSVRDSAEPALLSGC